MTKRKFYVTVIEVKVLSEEPYEFNGLADLAADIDTGPCSGKSTIKSTKIINGNEAANMLRNQSSDPAFFNLDLYGDDVE